MKVEETFKNLYKLNGDTIKNELYGVHDGAKDSENHLVKTSQKKDNNRQKRLRFVKNATNVIMKPSLTENVKHCWN